MKLIAVILVVATGCAGSFGKVNRHVGRAALITSTLTLICDGMQTLNMAGRDWRGADGISKREGNPIMGETPSVAVVGSYFVSVIVLNAAAWAVTPERYRSPLPIVITAAQTRQIARNSELGTGICGF